MAGRPQPSNSPSRSTACPPPAGTIGEHARSHSESSTPSSASTSYGVATQLSPLAALPLPFLQPVSVPAPSVVETHPSGSPMPACSTSFSDPRQTMASLHHSASGRTNQQHIQSGVGYDHNTVVPEIGILGSQGSPSNGPHQLPDGPVCASDVVADAIGRPSSDDEPVSQPEGASECSPLVSDQHIDEDLTRTIKIIKPGDHESTYLANALIDSGNCHENLISSRVVENLGLTRLHKKPSLPRRALNKLVPWTQSAKAAQDQVNNRVRSIDGTIIKGQGRGTVEISWFGVNDPHIDDPIVHFQPIRYETTHVIVDADKCAADIVLRWKEVKRLKLRQRFTAAIPKPPTADRDPEKYKDYLRRRDEKAAARDLKRGYTQCQPSGTSDSKNVGNSDKSGK